MGDDYEGSGTFYYPDWISGDGDCKNDGSAPDYMVKKLTNYLYSDQGDCCKLHFGWKFAACMGSSNSYAGSGKYFPDWFGENKACIQGTGSTLAPDYMQGSTTWLFDDLESCCEEHYSYSRKTCMGSSGGSDHFYVTYLTGGRAVCVKDCVEASGTDCGGLAESWDDKVDTQEKCCSEKVGYKFKDCMKGF